MGVQCATNHQSISPISPNLMQWLHGLRLQTSRARAPSSSSSSSMCQNIEHTQTEAIPQSNSACAPRPSGAQDRPCLSNSSRRQRRARLLHGRPSRQPRARPMPVRCAALASSVATAHRRWMSAAGVLGPPTRRRRNPCAHGAATSASASRSTRSERPSGGLRLGSSS